jgi:hypothetical protein
MKKEVASGWGEVQIESSVLPTPEKKLVSRENRK